MLNLPLVVKLKRVGRSCPWCCVWFKKDKSLDDIWKKMWGGWMAALHNSGSRRIVCENISGKKNEGWGSWGWEGVESMRRGSYWKKCVCGRKSVCFVVTVEPASMWPLPQWRQSRGNRADGWLAGVSASLLSTTGTLCPFVSISGWRRRTMGEVQRKLSYVLL